MICWVLQRSSGSTREKELVYMSRKQNYAGDAFICWVLQRSLGSTRKQGLVY
jgi:hypothetical protein